MTIGVIITVFNLERFVAEALTSVLNQTRKADRIIVVNDGSSDNSQQIIEKFLPHVEIITNSTNQGVLPSVLKAVKHLNTEVVALLDGDDVWEPEKLEWLSTQFETYSDAMMVLHTYQRIDASGTLLPGHDITQINLNRIEELKFRYNQDELLKESILSYRGVWLGSALSFRKSCLDIEAFENWSLSIWGHELSHQDQPLAAYLIASNSDWKIKYIHKNLFRYRIFGSNSSGSSQTLPQALRTLQRSKATLLRTNALVKQMNNRFESIRRQDLKLLEVVYLEALYNRRFSKSLGCFAKLFTKLWSMRERLKEIVRFFGVWILGPSRFLKLK